MVVLSRIPVCVETNCRSVSQHVCRRCLPKPSISSVGLIVLLARWCSMSAQAGGLTTAEAKKAADTLLRSILSEVRDSTWHVSLVLAKA